MASCAICGNDYDKAFRVVMGEASYTFDSFECAIQALAPSCHQCGCKIIGHGVEANGAMYCCVPSVIRCLALAEIGGGVSGDKTEGRARTKSYLVLSFLHRGATCGMTVTIPPS